MSKTILVTISDDRWGRKDGQYSIIQDKIYHIIDRNPQFGISEMKMWKWEDIEKTEFYREYKTLLDNKDASRNGRAYKPFIIWDAISKAEIGDYIIYTDCSPEVWNIGYDFQLPLNSFSLDVIHNLTKKNRDILTVFVKWDNKPIGNGGLGAHTHRHFTMNRCMDKMGLRGYEDCYMHASGMWCIRKTAETQEFVREWLKWNVDEDCCSLGKIDIEDDYSFWAAESHEEFGKEGYKMGHRHDQSISGLLINRMGNNLVDILYNDMSPYNFLQFCRTDGVYSFIDPNVGMQGVLEEEPLKVGDVVENDKGIELKIFKIDNGNDGKSLYAVGKSEASMYATTREHLKLKK